MKEERENGKLSEADFTNEIDTDSRKRYQPVISANQPANRRFDVGYYAFQAV